MPLRPLKPNGQPKTDSELTPQEQESRKIELIMDQAQAVTRISRENQERALLSQGQQAKR
jgi:hypothetical protein